MIVDSHCHLDMIAETEELSTIISRAYDAGVTCMQTICTRLEDLANILEITEKFENIYASVGVHPCEVKAAVDSVKLVELSKHPKIIGLGETGLDYYHDQSNKSLQLHSFIAHIHASQNTKLPVIVHTREAEEDTAQVLTSEMNNTNFPGLIHCFAASKDFAKKMLDLGFYISVAGIVTFKNATDLQDIVSYVPLERLLIETDAPYLAPVPKRGQRNEPAYVKFIADYIATLKNLAPSEVYAATTRNFFELFNKCKNK